MRPIRPFVSTVLVGALLCLTACSNSQVTETLSLVVAAADAAVTALQATGQIPPGTASLIETYLTDVSNGVEFATTELASTDADSVKAAKIAQEFATITVPILPAGTAAAIGATIQAVVSAVANFLSSIQTSVAEQQITVRDVTAFAAKAKGLKEAKSKLSDIQKKNAAVKARLAALPKK